MIKWIRQFREATSQTQLFFVQIALYIVIIMGGVIYAYGRLDFVRSSSPKTQQTKIIHDK